MERRSPFCRAVAIYVLILALGTLAQAQYGGGTGEPNDPFRITMAQDLIDLGNTPTDYDKHFILTNDIDLSGYTFERAIIAPDTNDSMVEYQGTGFSGHFDGQGHVIHSLRIEGESYLALFGWTTTGAVITNLGLRGVDIRGDSGLGALVAHNDASISQCYSTGLIEGQSWYAGGLVGYNNTGSISSCYSTASVTGDSTVGGLVAYSRYGRISSSYSTGVVSGNWAVGGLIGYDSYGRVINSFWDIETSGQSESDGGVGLTTVEMMDPEMVGLNGLSDDPNWVLDANQDYPHLRWEGTPGQAIPPPVIDWIDGSGTADAPYEITSAEQLARIGKAGAWAGKHFELLNDLDLSGLVWPHAVIRTFCGSFNGNGFIIRNLHIDSGGRAGLFGHTTVEAIVTSLGLEEVTVNGPGGCGALVGTNEGSVVSSYSTGTVSGEGGIGGLVGYNYRGSISSSYSSATVNGNRRVGGLVGSNSGSIASSYSSGSVRGNDEAGGLVGSDYSGGITASFWDSEVSGLTSDSGGIGLTTAVMQDAEVYRDAGWDFAGESANGTCGFWGCEEGAYPRLAVFSDMPAAEPNGSGTREDPYLVTDANDLGAVWLRPTAQYRLTADIDLLGISWSMPVVPGFAGGFDGHDFSIESLHLRGVGHLGLFGSLGADAEVMALGLENVVVEGADDPIGGLAGRSYGTVTSCHVTGTIIGDWHVGGLVGSNEGMISGSYSAGTVSGDEYVGGLVGENGASVYSSYSTSTVNGDWYVGGLVGRNYEGTISSSFSAGTITGDWHVGGLVGRNEGIVSSSYSTGTVHGNRTVGGLVAFNGGSVLDCYSMGLVTGEEYLIGGLVGASWRATTLSSFWDRETSGQHESDGGTGLGTAEMWDIDTYLEAGWDFVGEVENGVEDIWWIDEGVDYPRLWWERLEGEF